MIWRVTQAPNLLGQSSEFTIGFIGLSATGLAAEVVHDYQEIKENVQGMFGNEERHNQNTTPPSATQNGKGESPLPPASTASNGTLQSTLHKLSQALTQLRQQLSGGNNEK